MATRRTINFLPSVFQTDTNRKFLAATLDQLVSEPEFVRLDGFVGRKFAPTYKTTDSYIPEINSDRQNYQLEPSVVVKNSSGGVEFYSNYPDLINKIAFYGGLTNNHDRLFSNEYYTFNGLFDQDKFVNYQQYFWYRLVQCLLKLVPNLLEVRTHLKLSMTMTQIVFGSKVEMTITPRL